MLGLAEFYLYALFTCYSEMLTNHRFCKRYKVLPTTFVKLLISAYYLYQLVSGLCNLTLRPAENFENNCTKLGMKKHKSPIKGDLWPLCFKTFHRAQGR